MLSNNWKKNPSQWEWTPKSTYLLHVFCIVLTHLFQLYLRRNVFRFLCHLDIIFRNPSTLLVFCWFLSGRLKTLRHLQKMELCTFPKSVVFPWHGVRWTWFCVFYLSLPKKPFKPVFRLFHMGFPHFESSQSWRERERERERESWWGTQGEIVTFTSFHFK